jgi:pantoate--beta-alanine ligase
VGCPTVREPDGLAMSSRNSYLDADQRRAAPVLYRALTAARDALRAGERDGEVLQGIMRGVIESEPLARLDYAAVADPATFAPLSTVEGPALALLAVQVGRARLIDNLRLDG